MTTSKARRKKSTYVAFFLALLLGPLGLLYLSWRWALIMLVLLLLGMFFFPDEVVVVVGLWILPAASVLAKSVRPPRQTNSA